MNQRFTFFLFTIFFFSAVFSAAQIPGTPQDTLITPVFKPRILAVGDTVMINVEAYNQKVIYHRVDQGQTLYGIARYYGISFSDLMFYNMELRGNYLKIGQVIRIPISTDLIIRKKSPDFVDSLHVPVVYRVKKGETLYRISRVYFRMATELLKANNGKADNNISVGDSLLIGWMNINGVPDSLALSGDHSVLFEANTKLRQFYIHQSQVKKEFREDGVAYWDHKEEASGSPSLYALHGKAPINSVIRVYNPMTNRVLYAKVVGRIPNAGYNSNVKVVLAPSAAKSLGAIDPRFHVKIQYLK